MEGTASASILLPWRELLAPEFVDTPTDAGWENPEMEADIHCTGMKYSRTLRETQNC